MRVLSLACLSLVAALPAVGSEGVAQRPADPPRVILFIADGAGVGHWTVARLEGATGAVERLPVAGLVDTREGTGRVTESAAGATALATAVRTFRGAVGVGPDSVPRRTVLEAAEERGLATGLVTNSRLTDATPAAFAAHVPDRDLDGEIARQMVSSGAEVLMGGGREHFAGARGDASRDLLADAGRRYDYLETDQELRAALSEGSGRPLLGLFSEGPLYDAEPPTPSVPEMTRAALSVLDPDPDGFFLMVETEATDTWAHDNADFFTIARAMEELDRAVTVALEYQARRPETLIVVVADHETGGMAVEPERGRSGRELDYTTGGHTWAMVPLFAGGPGSKGFAGMIDNSRVGELLFEAVGAAPGER